MSSRRSGQDKRCNRCKVNYIYCYCSQIKVLDLKTKVSIIMHKKEQWLPSNTAQLTKNSLKNFNLFVRGLVKTPLEQSFFEEDKYIPLYLYPSDDAIELTSDFVESLKKPVNLIVPDGTWRQAKKFHTREPLLEDIPRVKVSISDKSQYKLRTQKYEFGLCTHEAISYALGVLENSETQKALLNNLKSMVDANLTARNN